ncbi:MAG TPA: ABC transporter ATP-binding protein [Bryobacteraceae bacterium]|jgi:subfamily B ATP-binding cassette protein MsbA|nr:ABC transporter ATP-binding protein [Bryobacteraceae bacterium]
MRTFVRPHLWQWLTICILVVTGVLLQLVIPMITIRVVDRVIPTANLRALKQVILLLLICVAARYLGTFANEVMTMYLKEKIILSVQLAQLTHIQQLPLAFFSRRHSVYLQSRVMNDARSMDSALVKTFVSMLVDGLTFVVALCLIFAIKYQLGIALTLFMAPFASIRYFANSRMRLLSAVMQEQQALASALVAEDLAAIRTVKAFCREHYQMMGLEQRLLALKTAYIKTNWFGVVATVGTGLCSSLSTVFVLGYGADAVIAHRMTLGQFVAVLSFLNLLYSPISSLVAANFRFQQSVTALRRVYEFIDEPKERSEGRAFCRPLKGKVEFRNVTFAYPNGSVVLRNVNFTIPAGSIVALVGATGAGKSTIVNLLLRFYEPVEGKILIDDQDINELSAAEIRDAIGLVDQQPTLFSGTIEENVRFARPEASLEEVMQACRLSYASEFIDRLPDGLKTRVGERGVCLSGGQCQRIALARVFLKNPTILVLDEAVSSVDSESERYIRATLEPLVAHRTAFLIAHRLSSLALARMVLVLDGGTIVEQGTPEVLIATNSRYAQLFSDQAFITGLSRRAELELSEVDTKEERCIA